MTDQEKRIKLAEAIGWRRVEEGTDARWPPPQVVEEIKKLHPEILAIDYAGLCSLPDPFTDANDDYAWLEFARENWLGKDEIKWAAFCQGIWDIETMFGSLLFYRKGDYARAALKVLKP